MRVGLVGTGFAAASHAEALRRVPGVELAAVAGSSADKARAFADRLGIPAAYGSVDDLLADDGIGAVHDCTPNDLHAEVNHAVLAAGRHLLSEKPLAMNSGETAALVEVAAAAGVVTGVCFNYRHFPLVRQARQMVAAGDIGPVHLVHGGYLQDWLLLPSDWNWRVLADRGGAARAVGDIGSHWIDLVQHVLGDRVGEVFADLTTVHSRRLAPTGGRETFLRAGAEEAAAEPVDVDTEDFASILLRFESGARGAVNVSQVSAGRRNRLTFELDGASGALHWDQEEPNTLWIGRRDRPNAELVRDATLLADEAAALSHYPAGHQEGWPDALKNLLIEFYGGIAAADGGGPPSAGAVASFADAHAVTQVVEAVLESARAGRWARVGEPVPA